LSIHLAVAVVLGAFGANAGALSLGQIRVQSALGEPLRAEIDVTKITAAELNGLRLNIASPETLQAMGLPPNPALSGARASLQRRDDGRYVIRLTGERPLNDPFVDLLLEAQWNSGRTVRDFTVLLEAPAARRTAPPAPITAPMTAQAPQAGPRTSALAPAAPSVESDPILRAKIGSASNQRITVNPGDTAGAIADSIKPAAVSLEQMLVALLRANPQAFIDGNVNRIRAGAVLAVPERSQAAAIPVVEAERIITAQSSDFNEYRRRLAENAPETAVADANRGVSGKVQTRIEDRGAANAPADKLEISQGGAAGQPTGEQLAQAAETQARQAREQELSKNLEELNQLKAAADAGSSSAASTAGSQPSSSDTSAATAAGPAITAPAAATPTLTIDTTAAMKKDFLATLMEHPLMIAVLAPIALLLCLLLYLLFSRKRNDTGEDAPAASPSLKDSFFGASGGETDPIAEAEACMNRGRDRQAEEVLRKALIQNPNQPSIYVKLLEVYARQQNFRDYEALLPAVRQLTGGTGDAWNHAVEIGQQFRPLHETAGAEAAAAAPAPIVPPNLFDIDLDVTKPAQPPAALAASPEDSGASPSADSEDPHRVKLSLARELQALGDLEGARSLIEEVIAESSGSVQDEARRMLGQL
jgi:pilus assembly protein FimV